MKRSYATLAFECIHSESYAGQRPYLNLFLVSGRNDLAIGRKSDPTGIRARRRKRIREGITSLQRIGDVLIVIDLPGRPPSRFEDSLTSLPSRL